MLLKVQDRRFKQDRSGCDVPNEATEGPSRTLTDSQVAPPAPNEATEARRSAPPSAPTNEPTARSIPPYLAPTQNEPIATGGLVQRDVTGFKWGDVAAAAATVVASKARRAERTHRA